MRRLGEEVGEHRQLDAGLAERRQHLLDVAEEQPVGADDEHALALEREAVGVEQVGGPVQGDDRLAGAGAALHDEDAGQLGADDLVLLALDGGDDVGEAAGAAGLEGGDEGAVAGDAPVRSSRRRRRAPMAAAASPKSSSSMPSSVRPRVAKWRRRARPMGSRPVAR